MTRRNPGDATVRQRPNGLWEARYIAADGKTTASTARRSATSRIVCGRPWSRRSTAPPRWTDA